MANLPKKNKWKQIWEIVSLYGMSVILVMASIYLEKIGYGMSVYSYVLGIFVLAILIAGGTKRVIDYRKDKLPSGERNILDNQQHYNKILKRKKQYRNIKRKHNTMLKEFYRNSLEYHFQMNIVIFILGVLSLCSFRALYEKLPTYLFFIAVIVLAIILIIHWIYIAIGRTAKHFEKIILESGYDFKEVDSDYMHGTICIAISGYLCIGQQYSVYCSFKDESFLIPHQQIVNVEKLVMTQKIDAMGGKVDRFYIKIYTNNYTRAFMTDDIGADVVLQEYKQHGIETRTIDMR